MTRIYSSPTKCSNCKCSIDCHADRKCLYGPTYLEIPREQQILVERAGGLHVGYCAHGWQDRYTIEFDDAWWARLPGRTVVPLKCSAKCQATHWAVRD